MDNTTPIPWTFDDTWHLIKGPRGEEVCALHAAEPMHGKRAHAHTATYNAELIVRAVNNYDAMQVALNASSSLVQFLAEYDERWLDNLIFIDAQNAIARAKKGA